MTAARPAREGVECYHCREWIAEGEMVKPVYAGEQWRPYHPVCWAKMCQGFLPPQRASGAAVVRELFAAADAMLTADAYPDGLSSRLYWLERAAQHERRARRMWQAVVS